MALVTTPPPALRLYSAATPGGTASARRAHPAGATSAAMLRQRREPIAVPLARDALEAIATGLAQAASGQPATTPSSAFTWTADAGPRHTRLVQTERYEAWLLEWAQGSMLDLHDTHGADVAICVVSGRLTETCTDHPLDGPRRARQLGPGSHLAAPAPAAHRIVNPGPTLARSVHVYSPPPHP